MRSLAATFFLAFAAAVLCVLAGWQWRQGNFDTIFGAPPTAVGQRIYTTFAADQVKHIQIFGKGTAAMFSLRENGWQATAPWTDRMDPRAAVGIINFSLGLRVEDFAPEDQTDPVKTGLGDSAISIRLEDANHSPLAKYNLGRLTPWKAEVDGIEQAVPSVFIRPRDKHHKGYLYACTGDITPLFKEGFKFLRDHRPFYFNPVALREIRIRAQQGALTLGRETPQSPWRIVKPLDLPTDPAAIKALLEGMFELQAVKVSDRAALTLPASENSVKTSSSSISFVSFASATETLLQIFPPDAPDAHEVKATVSDRPDTVFDLPLKPEPGLVSLADLPLAVNDLRDPTLTRLHVQSLRSISIQPATGPAILISRQPHQPWMVEVDGHTTETNEENLYLLLKAVTSSRAIGFESDAATDFTSWGLNRPFLTLHLLGSDTQALDLRFGMDSQGACFVNRLGSPTVMRVDPSLVAAIAVRPYEWRPARLWSLDRVNLIAIERTSDTASPLLLKYKFIDESWHAERDTKDLSDSINSARANFMLSTLEGLKVARWLSPTDEAALAALAHPEMTLAVVEKTLNDEGDFTGISKRTLSFAPASSGTHPGFYYGLLSSENHPFLIQRETYQKLADDLFAE